MIEIIEYKPSEREGPWKGTFAVKIDKWNMIIRGMRHIKTDNAEFITFPQKMKKEDDRWAKDFDYISFTENETTKNFASACIKAIREYPMSSVKTHQHDEQPPPVDPKFDIF